MKIVLLSKSNAAAAFFSAASGEVERFAPDKLTAAVKASDGAALYVDASSFAKASLDAAIKSLAKRENLIWGVYDPKGSVPDPAALLFEGAFDYLGPGVCGRALAAKRFARAVARALPEEARAEARGCYDFPGWDKLREGDEYEFYFLYAALGDGDSVRRRIGETRFNRLKEDLLAVLDPAFSEAGGKLWIADGQCALFLFPSARENSPIAHCLKLLVNRAVIGYDNLHLEIPVTFRFALHSGKTAWREPGKTGTVVSDSINFIYHFGRQYALDGSIYVTRENQDVIPEAIRPFFRDSGSFEGRQIVEMRRFLD